ncbi:N-acetylmuramic acid 6-phosphate etherase [Alteromonas halophila]|uniref:N-acetylmuramic acid 6-phosphate etherase n=1 Tax=Alteromonas halophila TaxID=516698 RepID=A0A918JH92_9ALTE|nr:N-acetylmuramic acid 6-phosphate etherase [Alteromonas halophila]GGW79490.1 N-acetylmuramic acid 6-phosphate etherase 1 [Alteromonas halophila]
MSTQSDAALLASLASLISEGRNPDTMDIDTLPTEAILARINHEDAKVAPAVASLVPAIADVVDATVPRIQRGGRLIYVGAGTSGRLGILDAVECRPTFSVPDTLVVGVIAGGEQALTHAVEGAEDDSDQGEQDMLSLNIQSDDVIIGLSASGRTPYVSGALACARRNNCFTAAIACSPDAAIFAHADVPLCAVVGPECLTGSTRMKSGTAQKLILNMLSTALMIRLGKTYQNLMVDVNASNAKLKARAVRIVMQATDCDAEAAREVLAAAGNETKVAILMQLTGCDAAAARTRLTRHQGFLRKAAQ